ncbi:Phosphatidylinositol-4-phosphate 5-kinase, partial [Borealophlyctis nickersoniae]
MARTNTDSDGQEVASQHSRQSSRTPSRQHSRQASRNSEMEENRAKPASAQPVLDEITEGEDAAGAASEENGESSHSLLRVSFKEVKQEMVNGQISVTETTLEMEKYEVGGPSNQEEGTAPQPHPAVEESKDDTKAIPAPDVPGPSTDLDSEITPAPAPSPPSAASSSTGALPTSAFQLQTQRERQAAFGKKRPNSFTAPSTKPAPVKWTGSFSVGTARGGAASPSPAHLTTLPEAPPKKRLSVGKRLGSSEALERRFTRQRSEREVLVGTPVKEGHVNYMLMYDMLTGIRISVSRCNGKPTRPLIKDDFKQSHKLAFDVTGNEMTPSSKYDFKFKDYAPWVFRMVREAFHVDPAEYLLSLTGKYVLSELGSPGKSGSFFYYSQDFRFIIKTIHHSEHKFLRRILAKYYDHVSRNPHTLLSRIFGLHRVKLPGNRKIHFVVMGNVFPPNKDIHETYDLKGSTIGREISDEEIRDNARAVMKDLNWLKKEKKILLGPEKMAIFTTQMDRDVAWLKKNKIMDYSLLIGVHDLVKGNKQMLREKSLSVFEPNLESIPDAPADDPPPKKRGSKAQAIKRMLTQSEVVGLGPSGSSLPDDAPTERKYCVFYQDQGGFMATDEENMPAKELYYIGIIDIFTEYDTKKKLEHFFKSFGNDKTQISAVPPKLYGSRFLSFMKNAIKGFDPDAPPPDSPAILDMNLGPPPSLAAPAPSPAPAPEPPTDTPADAEASVEDSAS